MNKKILVIGQKELIGKNLFNYFKIKKLNVHQLSFETFVKNENRYVDMLICLTSSLTVHLIKNLLKINIKIETIMI